MDSNAVQGMQEGVFGPIVASGETERPPKNGLAAPKAAGPCSEAARGGCLSNTHPQSSQRELNGFPGCLVSGGLDWFEWSSSVRWRPERFHKVAETFEKVKATCQEERRPFEWVSVDGVADVRLGRTGINRGGDRGHYFDFKLNLCGVQMALANRPTPSKEHPNVWVKMTGRDCLLLGAGEAYGLVHAFLEMLDGKVIGEKLSRVDLCLDLANLDVCALQEPVERGQFVTLAGSVHPHTDVLNETKTGFSAGKRPMHLTVYDKVAELAKKMSVDYIQAMVERRWGGTMPEKATRVEFQCSREWLRNQGVDSPTSFFRLQGTLAEKLAEQWFRLTDRPVDRKNKNQGRAETHPLWVAIQEAFQVVYGEPAGELRPIERAKIQPIRLLKMARGCLRSALLQMGKRCQDYGEFVGRAAMVLEDLGAIENDEAAFMKEYFYRQTEYLG